MKLIEACDIAWSCGLETIEEAINNIVIHAISLFGPDSISHEIIELKEEARKYNYNTKIKDIYPEEVKKWDEDLKQFMENYNIDF